MKRLLSCAPGLVLAALAMPIVADDSATFTITDDTAIQPISLDFVGDDSSQKDDGSCQKDSCGGKGGKGGCSCYLFGPDEAYALSSGDNCHGITFGGWTQIGYHTQQTNLSQALNDGLAFNDHPNRLNLHQQWLWVEKALSGDECRWDWGIRADFMYGNDASKTQAFGGNGWDNDPRWDRGGGYGWAIPQLYAEIGKGNFSVKMGHFYTLVGYEVVTAPDNFFYSHALTMFNSEPFTHTGAVATYGASDDLEVYAGWTAGWDTGFEEFMDGSNWLGGFSYAVTDDVSLTYISTAGNFGANGSQGYSHSVVVDFTLTEKLNYVLQSDMVSIQDPAVLRDDVGVNQYLFYTLNDCLAVGARVEWWKQNGVSNNGATFGVNYRPHANIVIRPEIRHDWNNIPAGVAGTVNRSVFGIDCIVTY